MARAFPRYAEEAKVGQTSGRTLTPLTVHDRAQGSRGVRPMTSSQHEAPSRALLGDVRPPPPGRDRRTGDGQGEADRRSPPSHLAWRQLARPAARLPHPGAPPPRRVRQHHTRRQPRAQRVAEPRRRLRDGPTGSISAARALRSRVARAQIAPRAGGRSLRARPRTPAGYAWMPAPKGLSRRPVPVQRRVSGRGPCDGLGSGLIYARVSGDGAAPQVLVLDDESRASVAQDQRVRRLLTQHRVDILVGPYQRARARGRPHRGRSGQGALESRGYVGRHLRRGSATW